MSKIKQNADTFGVLYSGDTLFFRTKVGEAKNADGTVYELSQNIDGKPLVRNNTTGKFWGISWQDLITFAKAAGIDDETEEPIDA